MPYDVIASGTGLSFCSMLGVCRALIERKIVVENIACTSGSSIPFGLVYGAGLKWEDVYAELLAVDFAAKLSFRPWRGGIFETEKIEKFINKLTNNIKLKELKVNFVVNTVDIINKKPFIINKDNCPDMTLGKAIRMTTAIPGIFVPVEYNGKWFVDGGVYRNIMFDIFNNTPNHNLIFIEKDKNIRISKDINFKKQDEQPHLVKVLLNSLSCLMTSREELDSISLQNGTIIPIPVNDTDNIFMDSKKKKELFDSGYFATIKILRGNLL